MKLKLGKQVSKEPKQTKFPPCSEPIHLQLDGQHLIYENNVWVSGQLTTPHIPNTARLEW
jgi:hypothetical protein